MSSHLLISKYNISSKIGRYHYKAKVRKTNLRKIDMQKLKCYTINNPSLRQSTTFTYVFAGIKLLLLKQQLHDFGISSQNAIDSQHQKPV